MADIDKDSKWEKFRIEGMETSILSSPSEHVVDDPRRARGDLLRAPEIEAMIDLESRKPIEVDHWVDPRIFAENERIEAMGKSDRLFGFRSIVGFQGRRRRLKRTLIVDVLGCRLSIRWII